jgi:hypothetical protein
MHQPSDLNTDQNNPRRRKLAGWTGPTEGATLAQVLLSLQLATCSATSHTAAPATLPHSCRSKPCAQQSAGPQPGWLVGMHDLLAAGLRKQGARHKLADFMLVVVVYL